MPSIQLLGDILKTIPQIEHGGLALYLEKSDSHVDATTRCAILDPEDSPDPGVVDPELARQHALKFALFLEDVNGIINNASQQINDPSLSQLLEALDYYLKFDAFIHFK